MSLLNSIIHRKEFTPKIEDQVEDILEGQDESDNESTEGNFWHTEQVEGTFLEEEDAEYEIVEREILPEKIICPDCGGITLEGLDFCDKCGGELSSI